MWYFVSAAFGKLVQYNTKPLTIVLLNPGDLGVALSFWIQLCLLFFYKGLILVMCGAQVQIRVNVQLPTGPAHMRMGVRGRWMKCLVVNEFGVEV